VLSPSYSRVEFHLANEGPRCRRSRPKISGRGRKLFPTGLDRTIRVAGRVDERVVVGHQNCQTVQFAVVDVLVERDGECSRVHYRVLSMMSPRGHRLGERPPVASALWQGESMSADGRGDDTIAETRDQRPAFRNRFFDGREQ
jgi:hypothetical protein